MKEQILLLYKEGRSYRQIQKELGCSRGTISYHLGKGQKSKSLRRRHLLFQEQLTKLKQSAGGKCGICGYSKCQRALEFHHKDPNDKNKSYRSISSMLRNCSFKMAQIEIKKCILICANCHREVHDGITLIPE